MGLAEILALLPAAMGIVDAIVKIARDNGATDEEIRAAIESRALSAIDSLNSQVDKDKADEVSQFPSGR